MEFPRARNTDPSTSHMAAASVKVSAAIHHQLIVDCLKRYGPMGKDTIAARANINGSATANGNRFFPLAWIFNIDPNHGQRRKPRFVLPCASGLNLLERSS